MEVLIGGRSQASGDIHQVRTKMWDELEFMGT